MTISLYLDYHWLEDSPRAKLEMFKDELLLVEQLAWCLDIHWRAEDHPASWHKVWRFRGDDTEMEALENFLVRRCPTIVAACNFHARSKLEALGSESLKPPSTEKPSPAATSKTAGSTSTPSCTPTSLTPAPPYATRSTT